MNIRELAAFVPPVKIIGRVTGVKGPVISARIPAAAIGDIVEIITPLQAKLSGEQFMRVANDEKSTLLGEVTAFSGTNVVISPLGPTRGVNPGSLVRAKSGTPRISPSSNILGCLLNGTGEIIQRLTPRVTSNLPNEGQLIAPPVALHNLPPKPLERKAVSQIFKTGIKVIDSFATLGFGQRIAIFAEPGVGKSTLLSSIAKFSSADVNVIALIGERGREVQELCKERLVDKTLARTIIVASTSSDPALMRIYAAQCATRIAEFFRDSGMNVLLQIDSLTRLFRAYREVGLAAGEMPVRRGYPPSVFAELPQLVERAGRTTTGSITAIYTVLLSAEYDEDPMVEELKGLVDGHIILSRKIAELGRFPAMDLATSCSRLAGELLPPEVLVAVTKLREKSALFREQKELQLLSSKTDPNFEVLAQLNAQLESFLKQSASDFCALEDTFNKVCLLAG